MSAEEFKESYLSLSESLYRVAFYILESGADAEDAVQDLYLKLWNSRDALDSVRNPRAYSITLLRNICIDRIRRAGTSGTEELQETIPADDAADRGLYTREQFDSVMKAVQNLTESEREVLRMRAYEELSYDEMARLTGRSALTLRVLLSNARRKIKKALS